MACRILIQWEVLVGQVVDQQYQQQQIWQQCHQGPRLMALFYVHVVVTWQWASNQQLVSLVELESYQSHKDKIPWGRLSLSLSLSLCLNRENFKTYTTHPDQVPSTSNNSGGEMEQSPQKSSSHYISHLRKMFMRLLGNKLG